MKVSIGRGLLVWIIVGAAIVGAALALIATSIPAVVSNTSASAYFTTSAPICAVRDGGRMVYVELPITAPRHGSVHLDQVHITSGSGYDAVGFTEVDKGTGFGADELAPSQNDLDGIFESSISMRDDSLDSNLLIGVKVHAGGNARLTTAQLHVGLGEPAGTQDVRLGVDVRGGACTTGN